jgi:hypothetical protein
MRQTNTGERRGARCKRYQTLTAFYRADPRRVKSREHDVGLWWREDAHGPLHRAAWVSDTGELYLVRLGPTEQGGGQVEVLATVAEQERLERVLEGWRERCGEPRSLAWLRARAARLGGRARAAQAELAASFAAAGAMLATVSSLAPDVA